MSQVDFLTVILVINGTDYVYLIVNKVYLGWLYCQTLALIM